MYTKMHVAMHSAMTALSDTAHFGRVTLRRRMAPIALKLCLNSAIGNKVTQFLFSPKTGDVRLPSSLRNCEAGEEEEPTA